MFVSTDTHCQDKERLRASLTSNVAVDYTGVVPSWGSKQYTASAFVDEWLSQVHLGLKPLATQHLLALHYFESVSDSEIRRRVAADREPRPARRRRGFRQPDVQD
jgi:Scytalone dehydratase